MSKICEFENCRHKASYALIYGKAIRCKEHKENFKPQYNICVCGKAHPRFNFPDEHRALYCGSCKKNNMVNIIHPKCIICKNKRPSFNYMDKSKPLYCANCKKDKMIDVRSKKCILDKMDEEIRYNDLYMAYSGKWIYIRFNPDKYIDKNGQNINPEISTRLRVLKEEIDKQIKRINLEQNEELLEKIYLYYDQYN